jgi:hypothetical protein
MRMATLIRPATPPEVMRSARRPLLAMILLGLFAVLIVHIIWYPWPDRPSLAETGHQ